ncbi:trypsin-like peptidase domain-containing protein [Halobacteriovorax sp. DPLXC-1]|uniref:trypsin-like peptidase domain-containing protein n=1 Tax=Halobacteriovorax sp. DPLXC-1 TaxID=3110771 RepID=UPI002FEF571E
MAKYLILCLIAFSIQARQVVTYCYETDDGKAASATLIKYQGKCMLVTNAHAVKNTKNKVVIKPIPNDLRANNGLAQAQSLAPGNSRFHSNQTIKKDLLWKYERRFFDESLSQEVETEVQVFDTTKDLAILSVPSEIKNGVCRDLEPVWEMSPKRLKEKSKSVMTIGCTKEKRNQEMYPKVSYTDETIYENGNLRPTFKKASFKEIESGYDGKKLLHFSNLKASFGQSGGPTVTQDGLLIGLQTQSDLKQDKTFVISFADIKNYVENPTQNNSENEYEKAQKLDQLKTSGEGTGTSGEGTGTSGEGTGTSGEGTGTSGEGTGTSGEGTGTSGEGTGTSGEGTGTSGEGTGTSGEGTGTSGEGTGTSGEGTGTSGEGTGTGLQCFNYNDIGEFMPREGLFLESIGDILIGMDTRFLSDPGLVLNYADDAIRIERDSEGYPPLQIRKNNLQNMLGTYSFKDSIHKVAQKDEENLQGWEYSEQGDSPTEISLSKNEDESYTLKINIDDHFTTKPMNQFFDGVHMGSYKDNDEYKVTYSDDYKTIELKSENEVLRCENKHYMKLYCKGKYSVFSLSTDRLSRRDREANFRYVQGANGPRIKNHFYFGEGRVSND